MAAGCFDVVWRMLRAAGRIVGAVWRAFWASVVALLALFFTLGIIYTVGTLMMPLAYSTPVVYSQLNAGVTRFNTMTQPITQTVRTMLACTDDPITDLHNQFVTSVVGVFRATLDLLGTLGVPNIPNWFPWARSQTLGARRIIEAEHARREADRRDAIANDPVLKGWDKVREMFAPQPSALPRGPVEDICTVVDAPLSFLGDLVDIYGTYTKGFIQILGKFYNITTGFDTDYITILVRYFLFILAKQIPYLSCIINIDGLDIKDPSTYFLDPYSVLACLCPAYDNRSEVPGDIPLAFVGCFCPLNGYNTIPDVIIHCIPGIAQALDDLIWLKDEFLKFTRVTLSGIQTAYNTLYNLVYAALGRVQGVIDDANSFLSSLGRDGLPHGTCIVNRTIVYQNYTCRAAPLDIPATPLPPRQQPQLDHAARFAEGFARKMEMHRARATEKSDELYAVLSADLGPLLDGSIFNGFADSVARRLGPEAGERAAVMHTGLIAYVRAIYDTWGAPSVHHVHEALLAPEIVAGFAAMPEVIIAHRAARGETTPFGARGVDQARMAVRSVFAPEAMAPLIVELRSLGRHDAADEAERWAGALHPRAWASPMARMGAAAAKERREHARRAAATLEAAAADAARGNSIVMHVGGVGGMFVLSIFSQLVSVPAGPLIGVGASVVAAGGALIVTAFPVVFSIAGQFATAFFTVLSGDLSVPQNDPITFLTNIYYPPIANGVFDGYTDEMLQQMISSTIDLFERELMWGLADVTRMVLSFIAHIEGMELDGDGRPTGDYVGWITDNVLDGPVDQPCLSSADVGGYPCRLKSDMHVECKEGDPLSRGMCYGFSLFCKTSANCNSGVRCMNPATSYSTECTPSDSACALNLGICFNPCFVNVDCAPLGGGLQCYDRATNAFDCTDEDPCSACTSVAFPFRAYKRFPDLDLTPPGIPDCGALGITLDDLDYWNTPAFQTYGLHPRFIFTWDFVVFYARCVRTTYQATRVFAGWVVSEWNIRRTTIFAGIMSNLFVVLPTGVFHSASRFALAGDFASGAVGGASGLHSAGTFLQAWPWPFYYLGNEFVYIATFQSPPGAAVQECIVSSGGPILYTLGLAIIVAVLGAVVVISGLALSFLMFGWDVVASVLRISLGMFRVGQAGTILARNHALPVPGDVGYGGAPDAVGKIHRPRDYQRGHPLRARHIRDIHVLPGINVRPAQRPAQKMPWPQALGHGFNIMMNGAGGVIRRRGRIAKHEWPDLLHDEHGPMRPRLVLIERT